MLAKKGSAMCDCCNNENSAELTSKTPKDVGAARRTYTVEGMTCGHCEASVTEEVSQVPGVVAVDVDFATGQLAVTGDVSDEDVKVAVEEAGYRVARD